MSGLSAGLSGSVGLGKTVSGGFGVSGSGVSAAKGGLSGGIAINPSIDVCVFELIGCEGDDCEK